MQFGHLDELIYCMMVPFGQLLHSLDFMRFLGEEVMSSAKGGSETPTKADVGDKAIVFFKHHEER